MKYLKNIPFIFVLIVSCFLLNPLSIAAKPDKKIQTVVNLLDYIARDYSGAVENKKIISPAEYAEMTDFGSTIFSLGSEITFKQPKAQEHILAQIKQLQQFIVDKADISEIDSLSKRIRAEIIKETGFNVLPAHYPNIAAGKSLYALNCASCHGNTGDGNGIAGQQLDPRPTSFLDTESMDAVSPLAAFNTISIGLQGTAMRSFSAELSETQIWDLAFYIKSLAANQAGMDSVKAKKIIASLKTPIPLDDIASLSDTDLFKSLEGRENERRQLLSALRMQTPPNGPNAYIETAKTNLANALSAYEKGDFDQARQLTLTAYLEGIEPIEAQLKATDPKLNAAIEEQMLLVRKFIESKKTPQQVRQQIEIAFKLTDDAFKVLGEKKFTFWFSLLLTMSILLREGIEAFLIVALLLAIVRKTDFKKALVWIHGGWIAAIAAGLAGWLLSDWLLLISGASREIMEGFVSLFAVVILAYVGLWLHTHSNGQKWKEFVEIRLMKLVQSESLFGLSFFVFMVVFREAFESILFLQAIKLQTVESESSAIGLGTIASFIVIGVFVACILKFSKRLPIPQLFTFFAWIVAFLTVVLIGKGIHSLQEAGFISVSALPFNIRVELLGIYPTLQTVGAQIILAILVLTVMLRKSRLQLKETLSEENITN